MGKIIDFPTTFDKEWLELKKDFQKRLLESGASQEQADLVIDRVKAGFYEPFSASIQLAPPFPKTMTEAEIDTVMASISASIQEDFQEIFGRIRRSLLTKQAEMYIEIVRFINNRP